MATLQETIAMPTRSLKYIVDIQSASNNKVLEFSLLNFCEKFGQQIYHVVSRGSEKRAGRIEKPQNVSFRNATYRKRGRSLNNFNNSFIM